MRAVPFAIFCFAFCGCSYISKKEFDAIWDEDEDGWGFEDDCDDANPLVYPYAPDVRGDGCDADCSYESDSDGDDWPDSADCDANNGDVFPCNPNEIDSDTVDSDCDGLTTIRTTPCNDVSDWPKHLGVDPDYPPSSTSTSDRVQMPMDSNTCGPAL
jgi:hypothetical protein